MTIRKVSLSEIDIIPGHNFREEVKTGDLEQSMAAVGLLHPIHIVQTSDGRFALNSGERRFRAALALGWSEIEARILEGGDEVALELAAIDENIIRRDLKGASLDGALARRKELYLARFPETAQYVAGAVGANGLGDERTPSFTEDTADKTGKSPRTIERSVRRAERLSPATMEAYEQGRISQTQADILAGLPHKGQGVVLDKVVGKSVDETRRIVSGALGEEPPKSVDRAPMQLLEDLFMHGQKIVSLLERLGRRDDLGEELVDSIAGLQQTLHSEFEAFSASVGAARHQEAPEEPEEAPQAPAEEPHQAAEEPTEHDEDFPAEPPF